MSVFRLYYICFTCFMFFSGIVIIVKLERGCYVSLSAEFGATINLNSMMAIQWIVHQEGIASQASNKTIADMG